MSIRVTVRTGDLQARAEQAARRASQIVMGELFAAMQQSFTKKAWPWPRDLATRSVPGATLAEKIRSYDDGKGLAVGSPRNLIDTGNLRQSGSFRMVGNTRAVFAWSAIYATAVHEGAYIHPWGNKQAARVYLPPRPWTRAVLGLEDTPGIEPFPLAERLRDVWLQSLRKGR
jgi:hypothetical protein